MTSTEPRHRLNDSAIFEIMLLGDGKCPRCRRDVAALEGQPIKSCGFASGGEIIRHAGADGPRQLTDNGEQG